MERHLSDYPTHFQNSTFPLLSFMYAVLAGGEHTIYCDHTAEFMAEYLLKPFGGTYHTAPTHVRRFIDQLAKLEAASQGRTVVSHAGPADWDVFLDCLKTELNYREGPQPAW